MFSTKKILTPVAIGLVLILIALLRPPERPEYTGEVIESVEIPTTKITTTIETTILETTSISSTITTSTPTTTKQLTGIVETEKTPTSDCEDLGCPSGTQFVGSKSSTKYHYCDCRWAKRIKEENLICFDDAEDAQGQGYEPCGTCEPPGSTITVTTTSEEITTSVPSTGDTDSCVDLGCPEGTQFVGSKNSDKYHYCDCQWAKKINPENLKCFKDVEEAKDNGYVPCGTCKPPE